MEGERLYLVHVDVDPMPDGDAPTPMVQVAPGLYLAASAQTRSQLYHAIKRRCRPGRLLVAPLAEEPKFKGVADGVLTWLRVRRRSGS